MITKPHISVVIPVYSCEACLAALHSRLTAALTKITSHYEIVMVNDGSPQGDWRVISDLARHDERVVAVNLTRNFGQHYAITAGLELARGDWVVVMDCDLQDQPEEIHKLYEKTREGYDIVYGISEFRGERGWARKALRQTYFRIYDFLAQNDFKTSNLSFYIISERAKKSLLSFTERSRVLSSLIRQIGYRITGVAVSHHDRASGKSAYTLRKRFELAYTSIIAYSSMLLKLFFFIGSAYVLLSFVLAVVIAVTTAMGRTTVPGWASLITVTLFSSGLILTALGINGMYLEKMYLEVKRRPLYLVESIVGKNARTSVEGVSPRGQTAASEQTYV